jgi:hypothetical protein
MGRATRPPGPKKRIASMLPVLHNPLLSPERFVPIDLKAVKKVNTLFVTAKRRQLGFFLSGRPH